jgi:succinyl-CoA synthetase alpha subunit
MIKANGYVKERNARLIGPNCPGVINREAKVGIMPGFFKREL